MPETTATRPDPAGGGPADIVLARSATWGRAPSAHNTQPWSLRALDAGTLELGWHADRTLPVGDPTSRDLLLSLGCLVESLVITAVDSAIAVDVEWDVDHARCRAATLRLSLLAATARSTTTPTAETPGVSTTTESHPGGRRPSEVPASSPSPQRHPATTAVTFSPAELETRRTARGPYAHPGVSASEVQRVAQGAGLPDGAALEVLDPDLVGELLPLADRWTLDGPAARELAGWLRLGTGPARDGLTASALGLRRWEARTLEVALRPRVLPVLSALQLTRVLARSSTARPLGTVVALTAPADLTDAQLADLGRGLLRLWLSAGRSGLSTHPLSQLLDCPGTKAQINDSWTPDRRAYAVFRIGHPNSPVPRSTRLTDSLL